MPCSADFVYAPALAAYDHGPFHPLRPERFVLTQHLVEAYGLFEKPGVREVAPRIATPGELGRVHRAAYIEAVIQAGEGVPGEWREFGLGNSDNPIFHDMHTAASRVAGATLVAAESVLRGRAEHAFSPAGGLHHAMPGHASGFCVYNDPAVAIAWLLDEGVERVAYVDIDVHHGDGVQAIFWDDPRVLTISIHESGQYLFPGTGAVAERGGPAARGTAVNIPLPPRTAGPAWLRAFEALVPPLVRAWKPEFLVTQLGCDTHLSDPLAHLSLSTNTYKAAARVLHELAHDAADGNWLATGGGGYQWATVVPRAWTAYFAEMVGARLDDALPEAFVADIEVLSQGEAPATLSEEDIPGVEGTEEAVDEVVAEVKEAAFPLHGLA